MRRPDGIPKVKGEFAYSSDMWAEDMLWGATLRSPHPRARIRRSSSARRSRVPGVHAVLTHEDVPGRKTYGLEHHDQPVLAFSEVRYQGEPVAIVAADHPETARRAADRIEVDYEELEPLTDPEYALSPDSPPLHPAGNLLRHVHIAHGEEPGEADVVVSGEYEVGMQDQAFLGPESGLAVPAEDGGVDLWIATQWLHVDRDQVAACLDLPVEKVRFTLAGVGGAFGGREDVSMQAHACMLALHTGRPVKMVYGREESFFGHVHRHPAWLRYEHGATRDGGCVYVKARVLLDGGAYASSSSAVCSNAASVRLFGRPEEPLPGNGPTTREAARHFIAIANELDRELLAPAEEVAISATALRLQLQADLDDFFDAARDRGGAGSGTDRKGRRRRHAHPPARGRGVQRLRPPPAAAARGLRAFADRAQRPPAAAFPEPVAVVAAHHRDAGRPGDVRRADHRLDRHRTHEARQPAHRSGGDGAGRRRFHRSLRLLPATPGQNDVESFASAQRVFRGVPLHGGAAFTKDTVYLRGLVGVHTFFRWALRQRKLRLCRQLFAGKMTLTDVQRFEPLFEAGVIVPPRWMPHWLARANGLAGMLAFSLFANRIRLDQIADVEQPFRDL